MIKIKKITSMFLVVVMFIQPVLIYAENFLDSPDSLQDNFAISHYFKDGNCGVAEEVFEFMGNLFYFLKTDKFVFVSEITHLGFYSFAFRYVGSAVVTVGNMMVDEFIQMIATNFASEYKEYTEIYIAADGFISPTMDDEMKNSLSALSMLAMDLMQIMDTTDIIVNSVVYSSDSENTVFESDVASTIRARPPYATRELLLLHDFPARYTGLLLGSANHWAGNILAAVRLTESYTLSTRRVLSQVALAGTAISVLGTVLGVSISTIVGVASFVVGAGGVLFTAATSTFLVYRAEEHWTRTAVVQGEVYYWQGRTRAWNLLSGPLGWDRDRTQPISDRTDQNFNNLQLIMHTAARNYFWIQHNIWWL